jgi:hypothetical protein
MENVRRKVVEVTFAFCSADDPNGATIASTLFARTDELIE